jgi:NAD(P)-dependent dehydrogenase (short-subunit alcohol dehydrogenase family)
MRRQPVGSEFASKVVMITGAASGIGRATALRFAAEGARLHLCDVSADGLEAVGVETTALGAAARTYVVDVSDRAAMEQLADAVFAADGAVDILVNNAGVAIAGPVDQLTYDDWTRTIDVNLMGVIHGVHFFVPRMLAQDRRAHIVNTASAAGLVAAPYMAPYCASKFGVVGLSEALNAELAPRGIRVSAMCPGPIYTPIVETTAQRGDLIDRDKVIRIYKRFGGSTDDAVDAILRAVRRHRGITTAPPRLVMPAWLLARLSPTVHRMFAQIVVRLVRRSRR